MKTEGEWNGELLAQLSQQWASRVIFFDECGSTNDEARKLAQKGAAHEALILTERQTAGRGRRGQAWACIPGKGLACSLLLRPSAAPFLWSRHALAAGLAVAEAVESLGLSAMVKWPNDVWVHGRKICGILVEAGENFVIVGIGLNINDANFPDELAYPATSMFLETQKSFCREEVLIRLLDRLQIRLSQIDTTFDELLSAFRKRCALTGKDIMLEVNQQTKTGRVEGISSNGELLLRTSDGLEKVVQANMIRILSFHAP